MGVSTTERATEMNMAKDKGFQITCKRDTAKGTETTVLNAKDLAHANRLQRTLKIEQRTRPQYDGSSQTVSVKAK